MKPSQGRAKRGCRLRGFGNVEDLGNAREILLDEFVVVRRPFDFVYLGVPVIADVID